MQKKPIKLLTPKEAAARLLTTPGTLAKKRMTGDGPPFVKIGAKVGYDEEMIDAWLAARVRKSTSDKGEAA